VRLDRRPCFVILLAISDAGEHLLYQRLCSRMRGPGLFGLHLIVSDVMVIEILVAATRSCGSLYKLTDYL
jgi:hypothetical protein